MLRIILMFVAITTILCFVVSIFGYKGSVILLIVMMFYQATKS